MQKTQKPRRGREQSRPGTLLKRDTYFLIWHPIVSLPRPRLPGNLVCLCCSAGRRCSPLLIPRILPRWAAARLQPPVDLFPFWRPTHCRSLVGAACGRRCCLKSGHQGVGLAVRVLISREPLSELGRPKILCNEIGSRRRGQEPRRQGGRWCRPGVSMARVSRLSDAELICLRSPSRFSNPGLALPLPAPSRRGLTFPPGRAFCALCALCVSRPQSNSGNTSTNGTGGELELGPRNKRDLPFFFSLFALARGVDRLV